LKVSPVLVILSLLLVCEVKIYGKTNLFVDGDKDSIIVSDKNTMSVFVGAGVPPFKIQAGGGYFMNQNFEAIANYSSMFIPAGLDVDVISLGLRYYENENADFIYAIQIGGVGSPDFFNGVYIETSAGYLIKTNIGFYTTLNLRLGGLFRSEEKPMGLVGVDLIFGWNINY
jgi:hypothetical protein